MLAWRVLIPVLKRVMPIARLVSVLRGTPRGTGSTRFPAPERIVELARLACRVRLLAPRDNCLDRSLIAYRYLIAAGECPALAIGVRRAEAKVLGHAWITIGGRPLGEPHGSLDLFSEVSSFGPSGLRTDA